MLNGREDSLHVSFVLRVLFLIVLVSSVPAWAVETISLRVESGEFEILKQADGFEVVRMDGFRTGGMPGSPALPRRVFDVALPPDVSWNSVVVRAEQVRGCAISGAHRLAPAPPVATQNASGNQVILWGDSVNVVDGKDVSIYQKDADYPKSCILERGISQMRKWVFARAEFTPFAHNPVTGGLALIESAELVVEYTRTGVRKDDAFLFSRHSQGYYGEVCSDTAMDDVARGRFVNFNQALEWYPATETEPRADTTVCYAIITTNAIRAGSRNLPDFVNHKRSLGFSALVITEDDYGRVAGQAPNGTAEKIRQWLKDKYISYCILYVLLIGDPRPDTGAVPMKMCWPVYSESDKTEAATDYCFADLSGNWDLDGDGHYGEYADDVGIAGLDLSPEVFVGRIPVYDNDCYLLDNILQKTMDYQTATGDLSWRRRILLPESFSDALTDGAYLGERIMDDYLRAAGFSAYTLYQQGACVDDSVFGSDEELVGGATAAHWASNGYGLVTWMGHGSTTGAYIGYGSNGCGTLFCSSDCLSLDDAKPSIVYQCSCLNAYPEDTGNLSHSLLKSGAIAAVGSSRYAVYAVGWNSPTGWLTSNDLGYEMNRNMAELGYPVGKALASAKSSLIFSGSGWLADALMFNVYGDPQVHYDQKFKNSDPVLSDAAIEPTSGTTETVFTYTVHCFDEDGDVPITRAVFIDEAPHEMSLISGASGNGTYSFKTRLRAGPHRYFFYFCDSRGGIGRCPRLGSDHSPWVDHNVTLAEGGVSPTSGTVDTEFTYSVYYLNSAGDLPITSAVFIDGQQQPMLLASGSARDGEYRFETRISPGPHSYYFRFEDFLGGIGRLPASGAHSGPTVSASDRTFVAISTDKGIYLRSDDAIAIVLNVALPNYSFMADFYVLLFATDGQFWSPTAFGLDVPWEPSVIPLIPAFETPVSLEATIEAFVVSLPAPAPFGAAGQFTLFTGLVAPGTLTPLSEIGIASFALQ